MSDVSFPPDFGRDNVVNSVYMGDYDQGAATNSRFYYVWGDNRLGGPDVRVDTVAISGRRAVRLRRVAHRHHQQPHADHAYVRSGDGPDSFSIANDVIAFTRNGVDVSNTLTDFVWSVGNTVLTINHTSNLPGRLPAGARPADPERGPSAHGQRLGRHPRRRPRKTGSSMNFIVPFARITSGTPTGTVPPR